MTKKIYIVLLLLTTLCLQRSTAQHQIIDSLWLHADEAFRQGKYSEELQYRLLALTEAEKLKDCNYLAKSYTCIGRSYYHLKVRNKSEHYLNEALRIAGKCNNRKEMATAYRCLGSLYCEDNRLDSALLYLLAAEKIMMEDEANNLRELSVLHAVIGETYFRTDKAISRTLRHFKKAAFYGELSKDTNAYAFSFVKLGIYNSHIKNYSEAEVCFRKARMLYHEISIAEGEMYALTQLVLSKCRASGSTEIYSLMQEVEELKDSIFKKEAAAKFAEYEVSFETAKKESELKRQKEKNTFYILFSAFALVTIIAVFMLYYRNNRSKQRLALLESKEKERQRIARDLHDNLGSNVSYIISKSGKLLDSDSSKSNFEAGDIVEIKDAAAGIMSNLRETIWLLNKQEVPNTELADKLKQYIKKNLLTKYQISDSIVQENSLPSETAMSIYRCVQEIITNINKHSTATDVAINIYDNNEYTFAIQVKDNGNGFEYSENEGHYGLRNMKARMSEINARLSIQSNKGEGTTVIIQYG